MSAVFFSKICRFFTRLVRFQVVLELPVRRPQSEGSTYVSVASRTAQVQV